MLNKLIMIGRITANPELKTTPSGVSTCSFSLAVERNYIQDGSRGVDFIPVVSWRKNSEFLVNNFKKGSLVCVEGSIQTRSYKDKEGKTRYVTEVLAERFYFTGDKSAKNDNNSQQGQQNAPQNQQYAPQAQQYAPQAQQYAPQGQQYAPQAQQYAPQAQQYAPQGQQYAPQTQQNAPQGQQYAPQAQQYASQGQQYAPSYAVDEINLSDDDLPF
ncbi:MAG: single-stranded DNA-binding protein [Ruminococcus sp.]